jgi:LPXTG-motif cell wall-anchored protein
VLTAFRTAAVVLHCDVATVSVTVLAPQQVASKSETPKTVAAAAQLPKTGSSSTPLALVGFGLITGGLAITGFAAKSRRRRTTG